MHCMRRGPGVVHLGDTDLANRAQHARRARGVHGGAWRRSPCPGGGIQRGRNRRIGPMRAPRPCSVCGWPCWAWGAARSRTEGSSGPRGHFSIRAVRIHRYCVRCCGGHAPYAPHGGLLKKLVYAWVCPWRALRAHGARPTPTRRGAQIRFRALRGASRARNAGRAGSGSGTWGLREVLNGQNFMLQPPTRTQTPRPPGELPFI